MAATMVVAVLAGLGPVYGVASEGTVSPDPIADGLVAGDAPTPPTEAAPSEPSVEARLRGTSDIAPQATVYIPRDLNGLAAAVRQAIGSSGAAVGVSVVELGGADPVVWSVNSGQSFSAASTYKLAVLMMLAEYVANGKTDPNGAVCYQAADYEAGWFDDYVDGGCLTRNDLARRVGKYSGNTAAHMLVRDLGGPATLNAWAASHGATGSAFFEVNTTTSADLAALWLAEVQGNMGGAAAQSWLYPLLTSTRSEQGVPGGVPGGVIVVHKAGFLDQIDHDAAFVTSGPSGPYVLVILTDGLGGAEGWRLIATISSMVWQFEALRTPLAAA